MSAKSAVTSQMGLRPPSAFQKFTDKVVVRDDQPMYFGNDGDVAAQFNATRGGLVIDPEGQFTEILGLNLAADRVYLVERFEQLPQLNTTASGAAAGTVNVNIELAGTNADDADATHHAEGGVHLSTAGASSDQMILRPHQDAGLTAWNATTWGTDRQTRWETSLRVSGVVTSMVAWAGLKLTSTPVVVTDDNQAFFRYENGVNGGRWQAVYSIAGVDTTVDTGVAVAANTDYHLVVTIDSSRVARFYINGALVATSTALANAIDLVPFIGIQSSAVAVKSLIVRHTAISRVAA